MTAPTPPACTNVPPCDHGWIAVPDPFDPSAEQAMHCPSCHPGRRQRPDETREQWQARLQREDAAWARKRTTPTSESAGSST
jgi:hypothetical protein